MLGPPRHSQGCSGLAQDSLSVRIRSPVLTQLVCFAQIQTLCPAGLRDSDREGPQTASRPTPGAAAQVPGSSLGGRLIARQRRLRLRKERGVWEEGWEGDDLVRMRVCAPFESHPAARVAYSERSGQCCENARRGKKRRLAPAKQALVFQEADVAESVSAAELNTACVWFLVLTLFP